MLTTGVEIEAKFRTFDSVKFREEWATCLSQFHEFVLAPNFLYILSGAPLGSLDVKQETTAVKFKTSRLSSSGLIIHEFSFNTANNLQSPLPAI